MSAASLRDPLHLVRIADEIESFLSVLLQNAVRYLPHNIENDVKVFIQRYFLDCSWTNGVRSCGPKKSEVITQAKLTHGDSEVIFDSEPLNTIFEEMLPLIRSRYAVLDYEAKKKAANSSSDGTPMRYTGTAVIPRGVDFSGWKNSKTKGQDVVKEPSEEVKAEAQKLDSHKYLRDLLWIQTLYGADWPSHSNERKVDHLERPTIQPPALHATISATISESAGGAGERSIQVPIFPIPPKAPKRRKFKTGTGS